MLGDSGRTCAIPAKPSRPVPLKDAMQHRFHLVIGRVAGRDKSGTDPLGHLPQKFISGRPGRRLPAVALFGGDRGNIDFR